MNLGKLLSFVVLGYLFLQHSQLVKQHVGYLLDLYPVLQTHMDMASYRSGLQTYLGSVDAQQLPPDIVGWLSENYRGASVEPGRDRFGTPYQTGRVDDRPVLRSCGVDRQCGTPDDILSRF